MAYNSKPDSVSEHSDVQVKSCQLLLCLFLLVFDEFNAEVRSNAGGNAVKLIFDFSDTFGWCVQLCSVCSSQISASGLAALLHS